MAHSDRPPTCRVVYSQAGNGRPDRNTAEIAASSAFRDRKYSATRAVFCSFLVVAPIASQVVVNRCMNLLPGAVRTE